MNAYLDKEGDRVVLHVTRAQMLELKRLDTTCSIHREPDGTGYDNEAWVMGVFRILGENLGDRLLRAPPVVAVEVIR